MHITVPVRQNGRIVVPVAVREELNLTYGDLVELELHPVSEANNE